MDAKTRQEMRRLAEAFTMKAHETGMVVRPVVNLCDYTIDHLKQAQEFAEKALKDLAKVDASLPLKEVRAVQSALEDVAKATKNSVQRIEGAKAPLKRIIADIDDDLRK
jgi:hypothetical protein